MLITDPYSRLLIIINLFFLCQVDLSDSSTEHTKQMNFSHKVSFYPYFFLESFPSAMFPKLWNEIEFDLKETKSAKIFNQRVINIYLENYERFKCEKPSCISYE